MITEATVTCPACGRASRETMPANACVQVYRCAACRTTSTPRQGDCCVFCSYADEVCPPKQAA